MAGTITDRLALIIDARTSGAVTELKAAARSADDLALSETKAEASTAKLTATTDKLAASEAKLQVAQAKAAGDTAGSAEAQTVLSAAQDKAAVSKAEARLAADKLSVAELQAKAAAQGLGQEASTAGTLLAKFGISGANAGEMMSAALTKVGPLLAAVISYKVLKDGISAFGELTDRVRTFQGVAGASAQQASLLVGQMRALGVDPDTTARAFQRFGASIGDGTTKLGNFGVEVAKTKAGTTDVVATFDNLRKAYQASDDAATKDAIAKQLSLRAGAQLLPLLNATTGEINALNAATKARGEVFSQNDVTTGLNLKVAMNELGDSFRGVEIAASRGLVPALTDVAGGLRNVLDLANKLQVFKLLDFANPISGADRAFRGLTGATDDNAASAAKAAASASATADALDRETKAVDSLRSALVGELDARKSLRDATNAATDDAQREKDAEQARDDLQAKGAVDAKALATAKRDVATASEEVQKAQEQEQRAQDDLNKARERATALDLAEAQSKIALAGDKIGGAKAKEQQAQEKLNALQGSGAASAGELAAAQAEVTSAHDDVTQSILDQQQATVDLQKVKQKGTEQDSAVKSAEQRLADAHQSVADANQRQADAEDKRRQAEIPDPDFARKLADANLAVARAQQAVADNQDARARAALDEMAASDKLTASLLGQAGALQAIDAEMAKLQGLGYDTSSLQQLATAFATGAGGVPDFSPFVGVGAIQPAGGSGAAAGPVYAGTPSGGPPTGIPGRAGGGDVLPYQDYVVGEHGPEVLRMGSTGGTVVPHGAGAAPVNLTQHFHVVGGSYVTELAHEVARESAWSMRTTVLPRVGGR